MYTGSALLDAYHEFRRGPGESIQRALMRLDQLKEEMAEAGVTCDYGGSSPEQQVRWLFRILHLTPQQRREVFTNTGMAYDYDKTLRVLRFLYPREPRSHRKVGMAPAKDLGVNRTVTPASKGQNLRKHAYTAEGSGKGTGSGAPADGETHDHIRIPSRCMLRRMWLRLLTPSPWSILTWLTSFHCLAIS